MYVQEFQVCFFSVHLLKLNTFAEQACSGSRLNEEKKKCLTPIKKEKGSDKDFRLLVNCWKQENEVHCTLKRCSRFSKPPLPSLLQGAQVEEV